MKKLASLIKLLDDDSAVVQAAVKAAVQAYGDELPQILNKLSTPATANERRVLQEILVEHNRCELRKNWTTWFELKTDGERLETALTLLCDFQSNVLYAESVKTLLDQLATEFKRTHQTTDPYKLSTFLFRTTGLKGISKDYHNPLNGNLAYVIKEKKGISISLCLVYILVGQRVGLKVEGCNYPGHFLAKVKLKEKDFFVDCFHGGRFLDEQDILSGDTPWVIRKTLQDKASVEVMLECMLTTLANAYQKRGDDPNRLLMNELQRMLTQKKKQPKLFKAGTHPEST